MQVEPRAQTIKQMFVETLFWMGKGKHILEGTDSGRTDRDNPSCSCFSEHSFVLLIK